MNRRTARRGLAAATAVVVSSTLLTACAEDVPPQPQAGQAFDGPVLSEEQDTDVLTAVGETLGKADKKLESKALKSRVTGPALEVRTSQFEIAKSNDDDASFVTAIPSESQQLIIPTTNTWRRTSFSITAPTEDMETPRLVALDQSEARDDYKMWAWVQLIPGVQMPAFADAGIGSEAVPADDESLVATPADALAQYADLVGLGAKKSSFSDAFDLPDGDLVSRVQSDAKNVRENTPGFEDAGSELTVKYEARKDAVRAVRTADGGALVMGVLEGTTKLTAEEEAEVPPLTATQEALFGDQDPSNVLTVEYTDMVALYVPPKDADGKIRPLGYQHDATAASNE
ncbi:hypothetical protein [Isoptericola sp. BMS4]|uniref:hypothetical protein n=1 Tax=Isoptericola sp. BMS4 TaxID=2527875 RepID=UPI00141D8229|nr:hypothetical protein [Isoptericola sp. BMS4]